MVAVVACDPEALLALASDATRLAEDLDALRDRMIEADMPEAAIDQARVAATHCWDVASCIVEFVSDEGEGQ